MRAIVTVIGQDRVGIIASICKTLADYNVNILDISQTILSGSFTMVMVVDLNNVTATFDQIGTSLETVGHGLGLTVRIQREEIFDAMHEI